MKPARDPATGHEPRRQPGKFRAVFLAVLVHALFLALIVFGVTWQNAPTAPVQADLWSKLPAATAPSKAAQPKPEPPKPEPPKPEPPKPEPPKPEPPKPEPPKPAPPKPVQAKPEPPKPDPAIAEKAEREKREKERQEKLEKQRQEEVRKKREQEAAKKKQEQEEAAKKKQQQEENQRRKREEDKRKQDEDRARAAAAEQARVAAQARQAEVDKWVDGIKRKILSRANVPDTVATGTEVSVRIRILPGGDVLDISVTRSTSPTYSAAIERAIRSAAPLPVPPANSELFSQFRDLNLNFRHER